MRPSLSSHQTPAPADSGKKIVAEATGGNNGHRIQKIRRAS
jgi:hypothetical protein